MPTLVQQTIGSVGATGLVAGTTYILGFDPGGIGAAGDGAKILTPDQIKSLFAPPMAIVIDGPSDSEFKAIQFTTVELTVSEIVSVIPSGSATPTVTFSIGYGTDITDLTEVVTGGITTTSVTTGDSVTTFDSPVIPANSWICFSTTAQGGTTPSLAVTVEF